jgi:hypothetical protein
MNDRGKWSLLGGLVLVLLGLVAIRVLNQPEPQRVPLTYRSGQTLARDATRGVAGLPTPVKPRTPKNQVTFREPKNIFARLGSVSDSMSDTRARGGKKPKLAMAAVSGPVQGPPPPPPVESAEQQALRQQQLAEQQARQQKEQAAQQARQLMDQYRFFGYLAEGGQHRAFLAKGREIYIVRTGETLEGRLLVTGVDASGVKLKDSTTSQEATLPLKKEGAEPS